MRSAARSPSIRVATDGASFLTGRPLVAISHQETRLNRTALSVVAYKKKGKKMMRRGMEGSMARGMKGATAPKIPDLPVDPENEEFIMFVRSRTVRRWMPVTVMKGGWSANALAKAQGNKWGKQLYGDTLIKNIGMAFYKESDELEKTLRQQIPLLRNAGELVYGFKIRDKTKPNDWVKTEGVQELPPKEEVQTAGLAENIKDFFSGKKKLF